MRHSFFSVNIRSPRFALAFVLCVVTGACSEPGDSHEVSASDGNTDVGNETMADAGSSASDTSDLDASSGDTACMEAAASYNRLIANATSCQVDDQCQVLLGPCQVGLGSCHEAVNVSVTQADLDALGSDFESCSERSCTACDPAPPARCENGTCALGSYCGDTHNIGDVWIAEDNCSVCSCTVQGINCRDDACTDPCDDADLPECPRACPTGFQGQACHNGAVCANEGQMCTCTAGGWVCQFIDPPVQGCDMICRPGDPPSCEELEDEYEALLQSYGVCEQDEDCHVLQGSCSVGLGNCHEATGRGLPQGSLNALSALYFQGQCSDEVCTCEPSPPAKCEVGQCAVGRFCDDYDLGDTWPAGDDCNTCTCTLSGVVCTERVCSDPCEGAQLPECPPDCPNGEMSQGQPCEAAEMLCGNAEGLQCVCEDNAWQCQTLEPPVEGCGLFCTPGDGDRCAEIVDDYRDLIEGSSTCQNDSDCQWLYGQCGLGLGGCYEAVNVSITQFDLGALGAAFFQEGCEGETCSGLNACSQEPLIRCLQGRCQETPYCTGRELGEVWENGCQVCTCTTEGPLCDSSSCPTECEMIEEEYFALVNSATECEEDLDCQILRGHCGVGECFIYVNFSITQDDMDALNLRYREAECVDILCHCTLPFAVDCVGGRCKRSE